MTAETRETKDTVGLHTLEVIAKADRFNHWMYDQFKSNLKGEVLEIGSGIGNISQLVIDDGFNITLSDYNEEYCETLMHKFSDDKNVRAILQIDLLHADFENQYAELLGRFDSIFLLNVIEHIEDDELSIKNCKYLLKSGGHLIVLAPANSSLYCNLDKELGHHRRYSLSTLTSLLRKAEFNIMSGSYFNFTGIAGWWFFGKIMKRKKIGGEMAAFNGIVPIAKFIDKLIGKHAGLSIIITGVKQ